MRVCVCACVCMKGVGWIGVGRGGVDPGHG